MDVMTRALNFWLDDWSYREILYTSRRLMAGNEFTITWLWYPEADHSLTDVTVFCWLQTSHFKMPVWHKGLNCTGSTFV
jgi:hypothetical protein